MAEMIMGEASGKELTDETEGQLTEDLVDEAEADPEESAEPPDEDLPEGLTEPEADKGKPPAEPSGESDVDRLKRYGVFQPGLVESFEDLAKSHTHAQNFISTTKRVPREDAPPPSTDEIKQLVQEFDSDDPSEKLGAVVKVFNAMLVNDREKLAGIDERLFAGSKADFKTYSPEIEAIKAKYPGMAIEDVYNMAVGKNRDSLVSEASRTASETERRRETDKREALREKPGAGVRTGAVDLQGQLEALATEYSGEELVSKMNILLTKAGK